MSGSALQHAACETLQRLSQTRLSAELKETAAPSALRAPRMYKRSAARSKATHHACQGVQSCATVPSGTPTRNDAPPEPAALLRRRRAGPAPAGTCARGARGRRHGGASARPSRARACRARAPGAAGAHALRRHALPEGQHAGRTARRLGAVGVQVRHLLQRRTAPGRTHRRGRARALGPAGAALCRAAGRVHARAGALWLAWRHCGRTRGATSARAVNRPLCTAGALAGGATPGMWGKPAVMPRWRLSPHARARAKVLGVRVHQALLCQAGYKQPSLL